MEDGSEIHYECSGNPKGEPALFLHGGPGAGVMTGYRRYFNPQRYFIVSLDQRGCGRSRPNVADDVTSLKSNTTSILIQDLEALRSFLKVEKWLVAGMSWGTTLAIAYAVAHPSRVQRLVLAAVTTTTREEVEWITEGVRIYFPDAWHRFSAASGAQVGERLVDAYYRRITSADADDRARAARSWCEWEDSHVALDPNFVSDPRFRDPRFRLQFATLVTHYRKHAAFLSPLTVLPRVPATLIHGGLDVSSPSSVPRELHARWPESELFLVEDEGHVGEKMIAKFMESIAR